MVGCGRGRGGPAAGMRGGCYGASATADFESPVFSHSLVWVLPGRFVRILSRGPWVADVYGCRADCAPRAAVAVGRFGERLCARAPRTHHHIRISVQGRRRSER